MNRRLQQFLAAENISQSQFADSIGVARASVSHIIAGRNKPGFDFIENMSRKYPNLNLEWLITGSGKMYKGQASESPAKATPTAKPVEDSIGLFGDFSDDPIVNMQPAAMPPVVSPAEDVIQPQTPQPAAPRLPLTESITSSITSQVPKNKRSITKIMVFYDDNTFQELS